MSARDEQWAEFVRHAMGGRPEKAVEALVREGERLGQLRRASQEDYMRRLAAIRDENEAYMALMQVRTPMAMISFAYRRTDPQMNEQDEAFLKSIGIDPEVKNG